MNIFNNSPYHLVTNRPWPIILSINLINLFLGNLFIFYNKNLYFFTYITLNIIIYIFLWWNNIFIERIFQGIHTKKCKNIIKFSILLFITSEVIFFISIFWCYLHASLSPNIEIGNNWPPLNIYLFNPFQIPIINTIILIYSGITLSLSHEFLINKKLFSIKILKITVFLGVLFTFFQFIEFYSAKFSIPDSTYGSIFFIITGFHGLHVIIGTIFLINVLIKILKNQITNFRNLRYELASWYWHFVDVIWLIVYLLIYWLPSN